MSVGDEPVFLIQKTVGAVTSSGFATASGHTVVVSPVPALRLQAAIGVDAFAALLTLAMLAEQTPSGQLVVLGGAEGLGRYLGWHRQKTGRVLTRLSDTGFLTRQQNIEVGDGRAKFSAQMIILDPTVYSPGHSPSVVATSDDASSAASPSGDAKPTTAENRAVSPARTADAFHVTASDTSMHADDGSNSSCIEPDSTELAVSLTRLGFVDAHKVLGTYEHQFILDALKHVEARENVTQPGALLRTILKSGQVPPTPAARRPTPTPPQFIPEQVVAEDQTDPLVNLNEEQVALVLARVDELVGFTGLGDPPAALRRAVTRQVVTELFADAS